MSKAETQEPNQEAQDDGGAPSKADQLRLQLKVIANYIEIWFAPIAAATALALAVVAVVVTQSAQTQSGDLASKLEKMNASLMASKIELEKLKTDLAQSKAMDEAAHKQQGEQMEKLVLAISQMQAKLKISPTLQELMLQPASAPVAAEAAMATPVAAAPGKTAPTTAPSTEVKSGGQIQALKQALDKLNKK